MSSSRSHSSNSAYSSCLLHSSPLCSLLLSPVVTSLSYAYFTLSLTPSFSSAAIYFDHPFTSSIDFRQLFSYDFRPPDHVMRRAIWSNLLYGSGKAVNVAAPQSSPCNTNETVTRTDSNSNVNNSKRSNGIDVDINRNENTSSNSNGNRVLSEIPPSTSTITLLPGNNGDSGSSGSRSSGINSNSDSDCNIPDSVTGGGLQLSTDVDIAALASKYELTGGFIKNAVLSALLSAISRSTDKRSPILTQVELSG